MKSDVFQFDMTVIVPVYNAAGYLERCVASLDAQTAPQESFEVVLINDGSTDKSLELCKRIAAERANYVLVDQPNGGVSVARNAGMRAARGRYLMFLDADDSITPPSLAALVQTFDELGDQVDVLTYPVTYYYEDLDNTTEHRRSTWLTHTGVYDLDEHPYVAQSSVNVCVRNEGEATPLFQTGMKMGEDQLFNARMLASKHVLGYCAEASYIYVRRDDSASAAGNASELSFEDMMALFEELLDLADKNPGFARYAYALVLYNVAWRTREQQFLPDFGDEATQAANYERLTRVMRAVPYESWSKNPYLSGVQRLALMQRFGVVGKTLLAEDGAPLLAGVLTWAVRKDEGFYVRGYVYGPALEDEAEVLVLSFVCGGATVEVPTTRAEETIVSDGVELASVRAFEVLLPTLDGQPYMAQINVRVNGVDVPAFAWCFNIQRSNGRRINASMREFGDRRVEVKGNELRVQTIKGLPTWSMPVVTRLLRLREKTREGKFNRAEVQMLREQLPRALRSIRGERVWLYVGEQANEAFEQDCAKDDGVVRLRMDELESLVARVAAFVGAERVVSGACELDELLPCAASTWDRVADYTRVQTWEFVGGVAEAADLLLTPYDCAR